MSDRRERVARAIYPVHIRQFRADMVSWDDLGPHNPVAERVYEYADAALAAMQDAEPTEAEVDRGELSYQISAAILPTILDFIQFDSDRDQEAFCDRLADKAAGMAITVFANHAARKARR